jgi:tripartite-type tricarboxylate transporter receptor subunit TctC
MAGQRPHGPALARAQGFAEGKTISIVLPYAPSAGQEVTSRILTEAYTERLGGTYVNIHRPGAGTTIAARSVAQARPDGTTLLLATNVTFTMAQFAYRNPGFDPDSDFAHISLLSEALYFVAANPRWQSVEQLVAEARRPPGELVSVTVAGSGAPSPRVRLGRFAPPARRACAPWRCRSPAAARPSRTR